MINLELYRIFYIVAESKNITRASEILNISQPAITKHIKNLECGLGNTLFIRTKKGVVLNEYGEKIYLKVKQALTLIDESEKELSECTNLNKGTIKIGISTSLAKKYLIPRLDEFHKLYPNIIIDIYTDPTKDLTLQLKKGSIDLIISKFPQNKDLDLKYSMLGKTKYIFACGEKYKELLNKEVKVEDLVKYPILLQKYPSNSRMSVDEYFRDNSIKVESIMNIASSNLLIDFIKLGYGIGYVTKLYVEDELNSDTIFEINTLPNTEMIEYGIITLKNNIMTSVCNVFLDYLVENNVNFM